MTNVQDDSSSLQWGLSPLLFVVGCALIGTSLFAEQAVWDFIGKTLDLRHWKVFTWITVAATVAFASYWTFVWVKDADEPLDEDAFACAKKLLLATSVLLVEAWTWVFLSDTEAPRYLGVQLRQLFCYGRYSSATLGILLGLTLLLLFNVFIAARWVVAALDRSVN